jgi:hypothetical protein
MSKLLSADSDIISILFKLLKIYAVLAALVKHPIRDVAPQHVRHGRFLQERNQLNCQPNVQTNSIVPQEGDYAGAPYGERR